MGLFGNSFRRVPIMLRFNSSGSQGYVLVQCIIIRFSLPTVSTAVWICPIVDMPVERMRGFPVLRTYFNKLRSVSEAEGTLYAGVSNFSIKSTEGSSQTETSQSIFFSLQ